MRRFDVDEGVLTLEVAVTELMNASHLKRLAALTKEKLDEIREFLSARSGAPLPDTVARLLEDVAERCSRLQDRGLARLIECAIWSTSAAASRCGSSSRTITRARTTSFGESCTRSRSTPISSATSARRGYSMALTALQRRVCLLLEHRPV